MLCLLLIYPRVLPVLRKKSIQWYAVFLFFADDRGLETDLRCG